MTLDQRPQETSTNRNVPTPKQALAMILVAAVLWVPMICFIVFYSQGISARHIAGIGAVNLLVGVSLLLLAYRKWIRNWK